MLSGEFPKDIMNPRFWCKHIDPIQIGGIIGF